MEGIINTLLTVANTEVAILLTELFDVQGKPFVKVNLRSRSQVDVAALAAQFAGGGHKAAAGCSIYGLSIEETWSKLSAALKEVYK